MAKKTAKKTVKKFKLKNSREWREFKKKGKRPGFIPANPDTHYRKEWKGWSDFFSIDNTI